jgi:hypothetical protein
MDAAMDSKSTRDHAGRRRRRGRLPVLLAFAAALATAPFLYGAAARAVHAGSPTRADLDLLRRQVARLEGELALARSRKPYLVVDAPAKVLRYGLLGMTMREIPARAIRIEGLGRSDTADEPGPLALAGIMTLKEKERDPRLVPLTPEQIEGGAADENVADALPPEAPDEFSVQFKQPIVLRVEGVPEKKGAWTGSLGGWRRLWPSWGGSGTRAALHLAVHVDETAAREIYRSLVPGERLLLVAPGGFLLPDVGQEPPRGVRPGRPAGPPPLVPGPSPPGVPFRIPPPVAEEPAEGASPAGEGAGAAAGEDAVAPAGAPTPEPSVSPVEQPAQEEPPQDPPPGGEPAPPPGAGGGA